ncbi:MAG: questin oxidase family protein [Cyclobacteriaceae bacterium]
MTTSANDNGLETLNELLADNQQYELLNGFDVSRNHVAMTLIALYRLGATSEQMKVYYSGKKKNENPSLVDENVNINEENWYQYLGTSASASTSYIRFFTGKIKAEGVENALKCYLPKLISGVAAHAYHPLIRLAYGAEINNVGETAFAMAYFASTYRSFCGYR